MCLKLGKSCYKRLIVFFISFKIVYKKINWFIFQYNYIMSALALLTRTSVRRAAAPTSRRTFVSKTMPRRGGDHGHEHMTFETTLHGEEGENPVVVFNTHPLAVAGVAFPDIAVLPPYTFTEEGISITLRGVSSGISKFLSLAREIMPPDNVKVINENDGDDGPQTLLGEKQWEVVQAAVQWGYYNDPKGVSMRQMAERLDMARSTLGEHLHNAEATIMKWLVENE